MDQSEGSLTGAVGHHLDPDREGPVIDGDVEHAVRLRRVLCTATLRWANGRADPDRLERRQRSIDGLGEEVALGGSSPCHSVFEYTRMTNNGISGGTVNPRTSRLVPTIRPPLSAPLSQRYWGAPWLFL